MTLATRVADEFRRAMPFVPTTILGRIIAVLLCLQGVLMTGAIVGSMVYGIQAAA